MLWLPIDRTSNIPLIRQIYLELRNKILNAELKAEQRLPATRSLAASLGVSRNVILEAYDQLIAEGYLEGRSGSGTYVARGACWEFLPTQRHTEEKMTSLLTDSPMSLSDKETGGIDIIDFRSGLPALDSFPRKLWGQLAKQVFTEIPNALLGYGQPEGCVELRSVLSKYLWKTRGVICNPEQIVITSGATQAFSLVGELLLKPGSRVILEDPVTRELQKIFIALQAELFPVPVDEQGLQTHLLPPDKKPSFIFVTPSHQFPLGSVLTIQRRISLLEYAKSTDCFIVEDDYDSEFRYEGTPVSSLQGLDPERVIYIGTFSKILSPALRIGYIVLPVSLVERCRYFKRLKDQHTAYFEQLILAQFIQDGYLERHIARMKKLYQKRRQILKQNLIDRFADRVKIFGDSTGLHFVASFPKINFCKKTLQKLESQGVRIYPVTAHTVFQERHQHQVILGYGNLTISQIEAGIQRLQKSLSDI